MKSWLVSMITRVLVRIVQSQHDCLTMQASNSEPLFVHFDCKAIWGTIKAGHRDLHFHRETGINLINVGKHSIHINSKQIRQNISVTPSISLEYSPELPTDDIYKINNIMSSISMCPYFIDICT